MPGGRSPGVDQLMRFAAGVKAAGPKPSSPESKMLPFASGKAIPVIPEHGSRQPVIVWKMSRPASRLTNSSGWPGATTGGSRRASGSDRSPWP